MKSSASEPGLSHHGRPSHPISPIHSSHPSHPSQPRKKNADFLPVIAYSLITDQVLAFRILF